MFKIAIAYIVMALGLSSLIQADGLLTPVDEKYPKDFLRNQVTEISVTIHGLVAETTVYQEFLNEGTDSTDAVYSFPLPPEARATNFNYWYDGQVYTAVLQVREQAPNPGSGEGGIVAVLDKYIGRNGLKIHLRGIPPGATQQIQFNYISLCEYHRGEVYYRYPLQAADFVNHQLEHVKFSVAVEANSPITNYDMPGNENFNVISASNNSLQLELLKPKAYLAEDLFFTYHTDPEALGVDFYSVANDSANGHFSLFVRPQNQEISENILPKRIFFLLENSSAMFGYKLNQSIAAILRALDEMTAEDEFNLILFNDSVIGWQAGPVSATDEMIEQARAFLASVSVSGGSSLDFGLQACLRQIGDANRSNSILVFSGSRTPVYPRKVEADNIYRAGIFPIGMGSELSRQALEMTAALNYGFVTYLEQDDNLVEEMYRIFNKISQPVLSDTRIEYGGVNISQTLPEKTPTTYAGSYFFITGRYDNPGIAAMSLAGTSASGVNAFDFQLDFSAMGENDRFTEFIWAKETIDALEREIEVYGEDQSLQDQLIELSLKYNIRCRYTAYVADYDDNGGGTTSIKEKDARVLAPTTSFIVGNYPNPFNPATRIRFFVHKNDASATMLLKVYNIRGQLVAIVDISGLSGGWHDVEFKGRDAFGRALASGIYLVQLQIGNQSRSIVKINLVK